LLTRWLQHGRRAWRAAEMMDDLLMKFAEIDFAGWHGQPYYQSTAPVKEKLHGKH
jgi:hypothetical protein